MRKHGYTRLSKMCLFALMATGSGTVGFCQTGHMRLPASSVGTGKGIHPDGQQPVAEAHIYLFAVGATGPNTGGTSLLTGSGVSVDGNGQGYVTADSYGNFSLSGLYSCPDPNANVYLLGVGGNPGLGGSVDNTAIVDIAALPVTCQNLPNVASVGLSEATTVAAAFALANFADTTEDGISTTSASASALVSAFAFANTLASSLTGDPVQGGQQTAMVDTIADILATCVNTSSPTSSPCKFLMRDATAAGYYAPSDIWQAAVSMVNHPTNNTVALYNLTPSTPVYSPILNSAPSAYQLNVSGAPSLTSMTSDVTSGGNTMTIYGSLGSVDPNSLVVAVGGIVATIQSFAPSSVTVVIPDNAIGINVQAFGLNFASNVIVGGFAATTINVVLNPTTTVLGASFTATATVSSSISITRNGTVACVAIGQTPKPVTLSAIPSSSSSSATFTFASTPIGSLQVSCTYPGTAIFKSATPNPFTATEQVLSPLLSVNVTSSSSPTTTTYGDLVHLTASVTPTGSTNEVPTGTVTFYDGATSLGTVPLTSSSVNMTVASLSVGSHTITASYSGDTAFNSGTSPSFTQTVTGETGACAVN